MRRMCSNSMKEEFENVNKLVEKFRDVFRCQICFNIKDQDSIFFYLKCQHFFCTNCLGNNVPCIICSHSSNEYDSDKQVQLTENENILEIFHLLETYESIFLPNEPEQNLRDSPKTKQKKTRKRNENKTNTVSQVCRKDDNIDTQKKKKALNVSKRNHKGETPLHLACRKANLTLMQELIDAGANPNVQDNAGWTPLHDSIAFGKKDVIKFLLENDARVNTPGHENTTPLHQAVAENNCEIVKLLMNYGADKNARNIYGVTPVDLAKEYNFSEIEEIMMTTPVKFQSQSRILDTSLNQGNSGENTILYGFNLSENETQLLQRFADQFKYKTTDRLLLQPFTYHIITSDVEPKITWSIISGVLMACRVINTKWIENSLAKNSIQSVEEYEMEGEAYAGFLKSQRNRINQLPGLFSGCHFYFGGNFELYKTKNSSFLKTELKILVEKNGGVILSRNPDPESLALEKTIPYHAQINSSLAETSYYIIYSKESWDPAPKYNMTHMKTLPVEWLLASIYKFELIDPNFDQSYMDYI